MIYSVFKHAFKFFFLMRRESIFEKKSSCACTLQHLVIFFLNIFLKKTTKKHVIHDVLFSFFKKKVNCPDLEMESLCVSIRAWKALSTLHTSSQLSWIICTFIYSDIFAPCKQQWRLNVNRTHASNWRSLENMFMRITVSFLQHLLI